MTASELRSLGREAQLNRVRHARTPLRGADLQQSHMTCVFRHLQRVPHASPSPRLSRLPISNPRGERSVCEPSVPEGRPRAERAISDGLGRGT